MAGYYWRNANNDQNGETPGNWDDLSGDPHIVAPGVNDELYYDGNEDNAGLPTSLAADVLYIYVSNAYAGITDFTDFAPSARQWSTFGIEGPLTLAMSGFPAIVSGGMLIGILDAILDVGNPIYTEGPCTIDWQLDGLDIYGGINASHAIDHQNGAGSKLTCDVAGTLDMGATADTGVAVEIDAAGLIVTQGADVWCGDFTLTAGTFNGGGHTVNASGDYAGAVSTNGTAQIINLTGSGTCKQLSTSYGVGGYPQVICAAAGETTTFDSTSFLDKITLGQGIATGGVGTTLWLRFTNEDDPIDQDPGNTLTVPKILIDGYNNYISQKGFTATCPLLELKNFASRTMTITGLIDVGSGDVHIEGSLTGYYATVICSTGSFRCGDVLLGKAASDRGGSLALGGGAHSVAGVAAAATNTGTNGLALDSCHLGCSAFDGDNITITADAGFPPEIVFPAGGTIENASDVDHPVGIHGDASVLVGVLNDGNITDYTNNQAAPGSLMTMGIGGGRLIVP